MPELWRFEREKGRWERWEVRKGSEKLPPPLSHYCALGFPSSLFSLKPLEFRHKLNFFGPPLPCEFLRLVVVLVEFGFARTRFSHCCQRSEEEISGGLFAGTTMLLLLQSGPHLNLASSCQKNHIFSSG